MPQNQEPTEKHNNAINHINFIGLAPCNNYKKLTYYRAITANPRQ